MKQNSLPIKEDFSSASVKAKVIIRELLPAKGYDSLRFTKYQQVFTEGNPAEGLYAILSGKVKLCLKSCGKEQILHIASENDYLGYECLMKYPRYVTSAVAITETEAVFIPNEILHYLMQTKPELSNAFVELLGSALIKKDKKLADISYEPVRGRLADALLELEKKFQSDGSNSIIRLTRGELASYVGSVRETITRLISEFRVEKLIETADDGIKILDHDKLLAISDLYK